MTLKRLIGCGLLWHFAVTFAHASAVCPFEKLDDSIRATKSDTPLEKKLDEALAARDFAMGERLLRNAIDNPSQYGLKLSDIESIKEELNELVRWRENPTLDHWVADLSGGKPVSQFEAHDWETAYKEARSELEKLDPKKDYVEYAKLSLDRDIALLGTILTNTKTFELSPQDRRELLGMVKRLNKARMVSHTPAIERFTHNLFLRGQDYAQNHLPGPEPLTGAAYRLLEAGSDEKTARLGQEALTDLAWAHGPFAFRMFSGLNANRPLSILGDLIVEDVLDPAARLLGEKPGDTRKSLHSARSNAYRGPGRDADFGVGMANVIRTGTISSALAALGIHGTQLFLKGAYHDFDLANEEALLEDSQYDIVTEPFEEDALEGKQVIILAQENANGQTEVNEALGENKKNVKTITFKDGSDLHAQLAKLQGKNAVIVVGAGASIQEAVDRELYYAAGKQFDKLLGENPLEPGSTFVFVQTDLENPQSERQKTGLVNWKNLATAKAPIDLDAYATSDFDRGWQAMNDPSSRWRYPQAPELRNPKVIIPAMTAVLPLALMGAATHLSRSSEAFEKRPVPLYHFHQRTPH